MADQNDRGDFIANLILPWRNTDKVSSLLVHELCFSYSKKCYNVEVIHAVLYVLKKKVLES